MSLRTVRFDNHSEQALHHVMEITGMSASNVIKQGVIIFEKQLEHEMSKTPYDIFNSLGSIPGDESIPSSTAIKKGVREALKRKHKR